MLKVGFVVTVALASFLFTSAAAHQAVDENILRLIPPRHATPHNRTAAATAAQIARGRALFLNETFGGNGRTCGTCHEPTRNFTIDPDFIATLPSTSPLFVAETNPALAGLENPDLMRTFGLILENLDGFNNPGVMRGVPHTLGLPTSIAPDRGTATRPAFPLVNALGWGGDGSPGDGSMRNFAIGAVVQHFPRTLNRVPGIDFRVPTNGELDALEAFQLSLGEQATISLDDDGDATATLVFREPEVETGKALLNSAPSLNGTRSCAACHNDAGALDSAGNNRQFDTGVAKRPDSPSCLGAPGDGGFRQTPTQTVTLASFCGAGVAGAATFRGDGTFNVPSLINAADTPPFFHNNTALTLEDAIRHYTSNAFSQSPAGGNNPFVLNDLAVNEISALLRTLNAMENIRNGIAVNRRAQGERGRQQTDSIAEALAETRFAIQVLEESPIVIYPAALALLRQAAQAEQTALIRQGVLRVSNLRLANTRKARAAPLFTQ